MSVSEDWKLISIKFSNKCVVCSKKIPEGEKAYWCKGVGIKHESCSQIQNLVRTNEEPWLSCDTENDRKKEVKTVDAKVETVDAKVEMGEATPYSHPERSQKMIDPDVYPHGVAINLTRCQFCGTSVNNNDDRYINRDRRSCRKCFSI